MMGSETVRETKIDVGQRRFLKFKAAKQLSIISHDDRHFAIDRHVPAGSPCDVIN